MTAALLLTALMASRVMQRERWVAHALDCSRSMAPTVGRNASDHHGGLFGKDANDIG
jgi:hypothetical protein